jgi:hypothetical protein
VGTEGRHAGGVEERLAADAEEFRGGAARLDTEGFTRRTLEVLGAEVDLPDAGAGDFILVDTAERLRTPEAWQEWLCEHTGREVWLEEPSGFRQQPENNYMARAEAGTEVNGYTKTGETLQGLDVWRKRGEQDG